MNTNEEYNALGLAIAIRDLHKQQIKVEELRRHLAMEEEAFKQEQNKLFRIADKIYANQ
jgi:hypothetical protein